MCYGIHEAARRRERALHQDTAVPPSVGQRLSAHWAALMKWLRPATVQPVAVPSSSTPEARPVAASARPTLQPVARATSAVRPAEKAREHEAETV